MFLTGIEWAGDTIVQHFTDTDGSHTTVTMGVHAAIEHSIDLDTWLTKERDRVLSTLRRVQPRKENHVDVEPNTTFDR